MIIDHTYISFVSFNISQTHFYPLITHTIILVFFKYLHITPPPLSWVFLFFTYNKRNPIHLLQSARLVHPRLPPHPTIPYKNRRRKTLST